MDGEAESVRWAAKQFGLVSREQLTAAGLTAEAIKWKLKRGRLVSAHPGVYRLPSHPWSWEQQAMGGCLLAGPDAALSHLSAAWVYRLEGLERPSVIDVVSGDSRRIQGVAQLRHHRSRRYRRFWVRGLPVTGLARTFVDLAGLLDEPTLEGALDAAHQRHPRLGSWIQEELEQSGRPRGVTRLRELLGQRLGTRESSLERKTWRALKRKKDLPRWQEQHDVCDRYGWRIMRVDFAWPERRVALHADSYLWHEGRQHFDRDAEQRNALRDAGWDYLIVTWTMLCDDRWLDQLARMLAARDPQGALPFPRPSKPGT